MSTVESPGRASGAPKNPASHGSASASQNTGHASGAASGRATAISVEHLAELDSSAIPREVAERAGVYTANTVADLPDGVRWISRSAGALPALVYPMREADGTQTCQVKPQPGSVSLDGRLCKYIGPSKRFGSPPQLPVVRAVDAPALVLVVEGCKQALAALAWAPEDWSIHRITGVNSWMVAGEGDEPSVPTPHLSALAGHDVVVLGDADAATNIAVFDGLASLGEAATAAGAKSVKFARIPGKSKQGVDDVLAALAPDDRREALKGWVAGATAMPAPLPKTQQAKLRKRAAESAQRRRAEAEIAASADPTRADIQLSRDWHVDCMLIAAEVAQRLGGRELFTRGGPLVEMKVTESGQCELSVLKEGDLHRRVLSAVRLLGEDAKGNPVPVPGLSRDALGILQGHLAPAVPAVVRISRGPVVRGDGTIVTDNGYDERTRVLVDMAPEVRGLKVPEHPTDEQIADAAKLLRDDLFEMDGIDGFDGWVFRTEADRTHTLAFLLTALLRSGFDLAPLFLADGLQRGVGKGELGQVVHLIVHGHEVAVKATPSSDAEMEKRITADLLAALSMIQLDEVMDDEGKCRLNSPSLTAAITAETWGSRLLGRSESLSLPQDVTWFATGNNVTIPGDMIRRTIPIRLSSDRPNLDARSNFRRNLRSWVMENRRELLTAALTLVRAWYDRGQPEAPRPLGVVTFTEWQRVVGGICHLAGFEGFLSTVLEMRAHADSEVIDNREHLEWVEDVAAALPGAPRFTAKEIVLAALRDSDRVSPYGVDLEDLDSRGLGKVWKRVAGRWFGDLRIVEDGRAHGNVTAWRVERQASAGSTPAGATSPVSPIGPETMRVTSRSGRVDEHLRVMPTIDGPSIADLGGDGDE